MLVILGKVLPSRGWRPSTGQHRGWTPSVVLPFSAMLCSAPVRPLPFRSAGAQTCLAGGAAWHQGGWRWGLKAQGPSRATPHLLSPLLLLELGDLAVPLGVHQPPALLLLPHLLHQGHLGRTEGAGRQGWAGGSHPLGSGRLQGRWAGGKLPGSTGSGSGVWREGSDLSLQDLSCSSTQTTC